MKAIVESGSTKTDFVVLDQNGDVAVRQNLFGFNPIFNSQKELLQELESNSNLKEIAEHIKIIEFYGAGCSNAQLSNKIEEVLKAFFPNARYTIESDLIAACKAAYRSESCVVAILGTGSNACLYDGDKIIKETPSLGYILGDEGSGNYLGKKLLSAYFTNQLPQHLHLKFEQTYQLSVEELLDRVYRQSHPNAYLATYNTFLYKHKQEPYLQDLIYNSFDIFFRLHILPYRQYEITEINFVGSIAYYYADFLEKLATNYRLTIGRIIKSPMDGLII